MRTFYTATGFLASVLVAVIAHDGVSANATLLPQQRPFLVMAAACWAMAIILDGITGEPRK